MSVVRWALFIGIGLVIGILAFIGLAVCVHSALSALI